MRGLLPVLGLLATLAAAPVRADEPSDLINRIYDYYLHPNPDAAPLEDDRSLFTKRLNGLFDTYFANAGGDEVGPLDFDPFISAQDYELKDFSITSESVDGDAATISVAFMNFDYRSALTYSLLREDGAWRVEDIRSDNPDDSWLLSALLQGQ